MAEISEEALGRVFSHPDLDCESHLYKRGNCGVLAVAVDSLLDSGTIVREETSPEHPFDHVYYRYKGLIWDCGGGHENPQRYGTIHETSRREALENTIAQGSVKKSIFRLATVMTMEVDGVMSYLDSEDGKSVSRVNTTEGFLYRIYDKQKGEVIVSADTKKQALAKAS